MVTDLLLVINLILRVAAISLLLGSVLPVQLKELEHPNGLSQLKKLLLSLTVTISFFAFLGLILTVCRLVGDFDDPVSIALTTIASPVGMFLTAYFLYLIYNRLTLKEK
jgi:small-conductance mechanosensitive channel